MVVRLHPQMGVTANGFDGHVHDPRYQSYSSPLPTLLSRLVTILCVHSRPPMPELPSPAKARGSEGAIAHQCTRHSRQPPGPKFWWRTQTKRLHATYWQGLPDWVPLRIASNVVTGQYGFGNPAPRSVLRSTSARSSPWPHAEAIPVINEPPVPTGRDHPQAGLHLGFCSRGGKIAVPY